MRKNILSLSIAAMIGGLGFAGVASAGVVRMAESTATALELSEGGVGHALIVPYFNAQNGNATVMHVVNTDTQNGKAVKVRFRGAANSDDILDFQVFMSPGDVWTAAVTAGADGLAQITTADNTCTLPTLTPGVAQPFITGRLNPALTGDALANQTREGYVEIFNMADIPKPATLKDSLYEAIKHVNGKGPCTAAVLNNTLTNFTGETAAKAAGFAAPTGSLMGDWYIINVAQTTTFSGAATAIVATNAGKSAPSNFVHFPQLDAAAVAAGNTADPLLVSGAVTAAFYDLPDLSTPFVTAPGATAASAQASLLTNALAVKSVTNQYANDPSISAKTDWVFSMPTRRYSVAMDYSKINATPKAEGRVYTALTSDWFTANNTTVSGQLICVTSNGQTFWDREENTKTSGAVFSPGTVAKTQFCGETSVLSFADAGTSVLGATVARQNVTGAYVNGWSSVDTTNGGVGLPILGASFIKLTNPQASAGVSGTYGITWPHRFTK
jgi:hypothetical protein